jgi:hypothetical protein
MPEPGIDIIAIAAIVAAAEIACEKLMVGAETVGGAKGNIRLIVRVKRGTLEVIRVAVDRTRPARVVQA